MDLYEICYKLATQPSLGFLNRCSVTRVPDQKPRRPRTTFKVLGVSERGAFEVAKALREEAEASARATLLRTIAQDGRVVLPIDVRAVAKALNLQVEDRALPENVDGLLLKERGETQFKAVLDANGWPNRRRFTLAHEIGHFVRDYETQSEKDRLVGVVERRDEVSSFGTDETEMWANSFGAGLLMPASPVRTMWAAGLDLNEMADKFGVSTAAMSNRLANLDLR